MTKINNRKPLDLINEQKSDAEIAELIAQKIKTISTSQTTRYQYGYIPLVEVLKNPEEYIIPECMNACNCLWNKNIETFMVSNYEDENLYIILNDLSTENLAIIKELAEVDLRYYWSEYRHYWAIRVKGTSKESSEELAKLTEVFVMQDTIKYQTEEKFLDNYKRTGGKQYVDEYGCIVKDYNPSLINATLEEALINSHCENLYVQEEGRIYDSFLYLDWHNRYKKSQFSNKSR